jgi:hypothetical protein
MPDTKTRHHGGLNCRDNAAPPIGFRRLSGQNLPAQKGENTEVKNAKLKGSS